MASKKMPKTIDQKLNQRQIDAIEQADNGNYFPLIQCCVECQRAINKAVAAAELGVPEWGKPTIKHYVELRNYLASHIKGKAACNLLESALEGEE